MHLQRGAKVRSLSVITSKVSPAGNGAETHLRLVRALGKQEQSDNNVWSSTKPAK
jgi:hypothetical protein